VKVLVTGGAGYIGFQTTLSLLKAGYDVLEFDNLCNSSVESLSHVTKIASRSAMRAR
jgi:UDP-glucose 4-epimerase